MMHAWIQFALGAAAGFAIAVALNLLPYWRTYYAPCGDGYAVMCFPFTFRREGGIDYRCDLHPGLLLADFAIGMAFAVAVGWVTMKVPQLFRRPGRGFPVLPRSDGGPSAE